MKTRNRKLKEKGKSINFTNPKNRVGLSTSFCTVKGILSRALLVRTLYLESRNALAEHFNPICEIQDGVYK